MKVMITMLALIWFISGCQTGAKNLAESIDPYLVVFTTDLDEDNYPVNDLKKVSMQAENIVFYTKWILPDGEHRLVMIVEDAEGRTVRKSPSSFVVKDGDHSTWFRLKFRPGFHKPGKWAFRLMLDDSYVLERRLQVEP